MAADSQLTQEQSRAIRGLFSAMGNTQMLLHFLAEVDAGVRVWFDQELVLEHLCGVRGCGSSPCTSGLTAGEEISFSLL